MNKEKAELYASLYARIFLITETSENLMYEQSWKERDKERESLFEFSAQLLDKIQEQSEKDLTPDELDYFNIETDSPNRHDYE